MSTWRALAALSVFSFGMGAADPVMAQCVECAQQMYSATLQNNSNGAMNDVRNLDRQRADREARARDRARRGLPTKSSSASAPGPAPTVRPMTSQEATASLMPEYRQRLKTQGKARADEWLIGSARKLGRSEAQRARTLQ